MKAQRVALCAVSILTIVASAIPAYADILIIEPDGSGDYPTIQDAVFAAAPGDTIELADGTFSGDGNRDIDFLGMALTLMSQSGSPEYCVIDCEGDEADPHRGFYFSYCDSPLVIQGIGVTSGYAAEVGWPYGNGGAVFCEGSSPAFIDCAFGYNEASWSGGAVFFYEGSSPTFSNVNVAVNHAPGGGGGVFGSGGSPVFTGGCQFYANSSEGEYGAGGGVYCEESAPAFLGCDFRSNSATWGGAVCCYMNSSTTFENCLFEENASPPEFEGGGGGLMCYDCSPSLAYCTFSLNQSAGPGGGVYLDAASPTLTNCTLYRNSTDIIGSGVYAGAGSDPFISHTIIAFAPPPLGTSIWCDGSSSITLECSDVYGNAYDDWFQCIWDQEGINGNIWESPRFCDPNHGDLTIQADSPCAPYTPPNEECGLIGAWPVACDLDLTCGDWIWGQDPCEFCGPDAFFETMRAEMNHDCIVDEIDYALILAEFFLPEHRPYGDFNWDGDVNVQDIATLASFFGEAVEFCEPCDVAEDSCGGRIRISFDAGLADADRLDIPTGTLGYAYVVGENSPGLVAATLSVYASANVMIEHVYSAMTPSTVMLGDSFFPYSPWPNANPTMIATVEFRTLDTEPAMIGVRGNAEFPEFSSLQWFQHVTAWPPEYPAPLIRHMGYEYISYGGINADAPRDSLACAAVGIPAEDRPYTTPIAFHLAPNTPNPWNHTTRIDYAIPEGQNSSIVTLKLFDVAGRLIRTLVDNQSSGLHQVHWDGTDQSGARVAPGVYFYRLQWNGQSATERLLLMR
ncbi:right-handed parallel beta-helix repeat-containing protein [Candidatus Eisenbacteria bacterium]|uniref:Right-handed parallel beta-helix repeat-containing protein n=1 Tax=Eiseniibacteriota bacterium TaxID=2212470 RepID=A0ABV6YJD3_UNCEI